MPPYSTMDVNIYARFGTDALAGQKIYIDPAAAMTVSHCSRALAIL